jgi:hypothetical protein
VLYCTLIWWGGHWLFNHLLTTDEPRFNAKLKKFLKFWRKRGLIAGVTLAPVLVGIPVYMLLAKRFKTPFATAFVPLVISTWAWCTCFYWLLIFFDLSEILNLSEILKEQEITL